MSEYVGTQHPHKQAPMLVWVDIDIEIMGVVAYLNTLPGVRTEASCQGTIGGGGPNPYRAEVMASWPAELYGALCSEFDVETLGECWGYLRPKDGAPSFGDKYQAFSPEFTQ